MSYRVYGETNERSWQLSHVPLLIPERDWREIAAGIAQRAELIGRLLADVYGDGQLVRDGALPAAAITGSPAASAQAANAATSSWWRTC